MNQHRHGNSHRRVLLFALILALSANAAQAAESGGRNWALVINGDSEWNHQRNVELAFAALQELGFAADNILLLTPVEGALASVPKIGARKRDVEVALDRLQAQLGPEDTLLIYLTGHGDRFFGDAALILESGLLTGKELARRLAKMSYGRLALVADTCYSGGFLSALRKEKRPMTGVTATDDKHEVRCETFIRPFWRAAVDHHRLNSRNWLEGAYAFAESKVLPYRKGKEAGKPQMMILEPTASPSAGLRIAVVAP